MSRFTAQDVAVIDELWQSVPSDHVWTGWSAFGDEPEQINIYRTRAHWRTFPLRKSGSSFVLFDERDRAVAKASTLDGLLAKVEEIPGLTAPQD